ncbi:hypothetical protein DFH09DRAFT_1242906 [Mycena vulgaris]|nr:hypothetical protein DFH09DRAFT_1242906 [Mycena vulgaris]
MGFAPEFPIEHARFAVQTGYAESKWDGERFVQIASERHYFNANVIRVGLLIGSLSGSWDTSQWVPALFNLANMLDACPTVTMCRSPDCLVHLVHPLLAAMLDVRLVPYPEWFARLKATAEFTSYAGGAYAALKLLDFFQLGLKPATRAGVERMGLLPKVAFLKGIHASRTLMNESSSLGAADADKWVQRWREFEFIPRMNSMA